MATPVRSPTSTTLMTPSAVLLKQKPIYIYPGLLRPSRAPALLLDTICPAMIYHCENCPKVCQCDACAICMESFREKDLVRRLPCDGHGLFHSWCILKWLQKVERCPLCNKEVIGNNQEKECLKRVTANGENAQPVVRQDSVRDKRWSLTFPVSLKIWSYPCKNPEERASKSSEEQTSKKEGKRVEIGIQDSTKKGKVKKKKSTRHYAYIVHDDVRFEDV